VPDKLQASFHYLPGFFCAKPREKREFVSEQSVAVGQAVGHVDGRAFNVTEDPRPAARVCGRGAGGFSSGAMRGGGCGSVPLGSFERRAGGFLESFARGALITYLLGVVAVATAV
jgi:hypothetical protein